MGPSSSIGATSPSVRRPAANVVVFRCPWGWLPGSAHPAGRANRRAMLVFAPLSSTQIDRCGSRWCMSLNERRESGAVRTQDAGGFSRTAFRATVDHLRDEECVPWQCSGAKKRERQEFPSAAAYQDWLQFCVEKNHAMWHLNIDDAARIEGCSPGLIGDMRRVRGR